jgi:hypothetical protein
MDQNIPSPGHYSKSPSNSMPAASLNKIVKGKVSKSPTSVRIATMGEYHKLSIYLLSSSEEGSSPIKPSSSPHSARNSNIKSIHVPNLNLNNGSSALSRSNNENSKFIKNLSLASLPPGSSTDRFKKKQSLAYDSTSMSRRDTDLSGKESPTDSTFFFYKNFDKFIQNLYLQDEKQIKKHALQEAAKVKDERLGPYKKGSKEIVSKPNTRKASATSSSLAAHAAQATQATNTKPQSPSNRQTEVKMRSLLTIDEKKLEVRYEDLKSKYKSTVNSPTLARSVQITKSPRGISKIMLNLSNFR